MRDSGPDHGFGQVAARRNPKAPVLKPCAPALLGPEFLVVERLVDHGVRDFRPPVRTLFLDSDRHREMRNSVKEVRRPIERIDDPARLCRIAGNLTAFLEQHAPVRARIAKLVDDRLFGPLVGHRDEVRRSLAAHLQLLDFAEVAAEPRRRLPDGALHDGDQAGVGDHRSCLIRALHIFAAVGVDDNARSAGDVRRDHYANAIVENRGLVAG